jgi:hypothetical protein
VASELPSAMAAAAAAATATAVRPKPSFADPAFSGQRGLSKATQIINLDAARREASNLLDLGAHLDTSFDGASRSVLNQLRRFERGRALLIDPRTSGFLPYWDALTSVALIYVAIVTPYEVGFLTSSGKVTALFIVNRLLDLIFGVDVIVQFFVVFQKSSRQESAARWANTLRETACNYTRGWLALDVFSLMPSAFDIIPVYNALRTGTEETAEDDGLRAVAGLRVVRVLRLLKMVKLLRVSRLVTRWQTEYPMPFATLTVLQLTVLILFATHWFGCILGLQASLQGDGSLLTSWYATFGYCWRAHMSSASNLGAHGHAYVCESASIRWFAAIEWGLGLVTGLEPWPAMGRHPPFCATLLPADDGKAHLQLNLLNDECDAQLSFSERVLRLVLLLTGALIWSYVIARFVEVIVSMNPDAKAFRNSIDELNRFVAIHELDRSLAQRLRAFMIKAKHIQTVKSYSRVYLRLSNALRGEVALQVNSNWFQQIHLLRYANERLCVQLAIALEGGVFAPSEYMPAQNLYLLHRGVAFINGQCLGGGKFWGLSSMMYSSEFRRSSAVAFTYCEVLYIEGLWLRELADACDPDTAKRIKIWAAFSALKQHILSALVAKRREDMQGPKMLGALGKQRSCWDIGRDLRHTSKASTGREGKAAMPTDKPNLSREVKKLGDTIDKIHDRLQSDINSSTAAGTSTSLEHSVEQASLSHQMSHLTEMVGHMHTMMMQAAAAPPPKAPAVVRRVAPVPQGLPPPASPEPENAPSSPSGHATASRSSVAVSIDSPATPQKTPTSQRWEHLRKGSVHALAPASRAVGERAGSQSRSDLLRMIQQAADDALEANATIINGSVSEVSSETRAGLGSVGQRPRSLVDFLGQHEDEATRLGAADLHEDAAQRNLARARSDESDMSI